MMLDQTEDEGTCQFSVPDINIGPNNGTSENPRENCPLVSKHIIIMKLIE